jgi:hypothetical protein
MALANMRELAEITTQSQKEAFVVRKESKRTWKTSEFLERKLASELHCRQGSVG